MSKCPKTTCIKCGPKAVLVERLSPTTRPLAGVENGREYSSITWYYLKCPLCGGVTNVRCPAFVDEAKPEKKPKVGARGNIDTGKIAKDKKSSQPKTSSQRAGQQRKNRGNRRNSRSGNN